MPFVPSNLRVFAPASLDFKSPNLNELKLKIKGADPQKFFILAIDGKIVGNYRGNALEDGIEIGNWLASNNV